MYSTPLGVRKSAITLLIVVRIGGLVCCAVATSLLTIMISESLRRAPSPALRALQETARVTSLESGNRIGSGYFDLLNESRRVVILNRAEASCSCTVIDKLEGKTLRPGELFRLNFTMAIPDHGRASSAINVYYNNKGSNPVVLRIEAIGRRELPTLETIINKSPVFINLASLHSHQEITIVSHEEIGGEYWIDDILCDIDGFDHQRITVEQEDRPQLGLVERTYHFRVGWRNLPPSNDFSGDIFAVKSDGTKLFSVGRLSGNVLREPDR